VVLLAGEPAQLALDGTPMEPRGSLDSPLPECPARELPRTISSYDRRQLAFEFSTEGVQLGFDDWQREAATALQWFGTPDRAQRVRDCGSRVVVKRCADCEALDTKNAKRSADCMSRICPSCAGKDAQKHRAKLTRAMEKWPWKRRAKSWWLHTGTCRKPRGTNVTRLQSDLERVAELGRQVWRLLQEWGCDRAVVRFEVGRGGMLHFHMLAHHKYLGRKLEKLRALAVKLCDAPYYNVKRANRGACAELAKYVTKGVARNDNRANQTHPVLSAMVDVAFLGRHLYRWFGDWNGTDVEEHEPAWNCPCCGCIGKSRSVYLTREQFAALAARQAALEGAA
jgi:hypothetical protein